MGEQKLAELRKKAAEHAHGELAEDAVKENEMAERARQLGEKGREQMPGSALDALGDAEKSMQKASDQLASTTTPWPTGSAAPARHGRGR